MLNFLVSAGRMFLSRGWIAGLVLIVATASFGTVGFLNENDLSKKSYTIPDAIYKAISLLAIQLDLQPTPSNWQLELARWLGLLFFASAVLSFAIRISRDRILRLLVRWFAHGHIIVAGLGQHGSRLVLALRKQGKTVLVLEPNRLHPAVEECRTAGAIVLNGECDAEPMLRAVNLVKAESLLALFREESDCVRTATAAYQVLLAAKPQAKQAAVRCVLRLVEPGLLDVVRRHKMKTDRHDRFQLEILNSHEIAATTMLREAMANSQKPLQKLLVLGLGTHQRLGEMVLLRACKDHLILHDGQVPFKLQISVYDSEANILVEMLKSRYPFVENVADFQIEGTCWARKVGSAKFLNAYDAAFVCISDEGVAVAQAVMLRRDVLQDGQPIMVRVEHSTSGYGELLRDASSGWGVNIHAVGISDALFDPATATRPEIEMRAQTIHHQYRRDKRVQYLMAGTDAERAKLEEMTSNRPWNILDEAYRNDNRRLAEKYDEYLQMILPGKSKKYRREFMPLTFDWGREAIGLTEAEIDALAAVEHRNWMQGKLAQGFRYGEVRTATTNPFLKDWEKLTADEKESTLKIIRDILRVLALSDYVIVEDAEAH
jgi:hypothetical protein